MHIIPLRSLAKVTCSVWRSFLCIQIIRTNLSQILPLPRLSHRMPCCLTSVPVGNTYTTYAAKCFALTAYIQFINVNHCPLKWDGLFCLHPAFLHYGICGRRAFLPCFIVHGGIILVKHSKVIGPHSGGGAAALHARLLCCNILF